VRKAVRRNGAKLVTLTSRPSALDSNAVAAVRFAPGAGAAALTALAAELGSVRAPGAARLHTRAGLQPGALDATVEVLREARDVVILWGERLSDGERGDAGLDALLAVAGALRVAGFDESGLLEVPAAANARGMREAGVLPTLGPGLADAPVAGMGAAQIAGALSAGELTALVLLHADPLATHPERARWEAALHSADTVIAFTDFMTDALRENATVVFPAESHAEKEGTLTHPDGRIQRVRQAIGKQGEIRSEWAVLAELGARCGAGLGEGSPGTPNPSTGSPLASAAMATAALAEAVPFYAGLTLEEIGGRGVRWQDRDAAAKLPAAEVPENELVQPPELPEGLRLGIAATLWAGPTVEHAPSLRFLSPSQRAELAPADARRIGVRSGDEVEVAADGTSVRATVALRQAMPPGSVFLVSGTAEDNATTLSNGVPRVVQVSKTTA